MDTAAKRLSAIHVGSSWRSLVPIPDATIAQADRQMLARLYGGILAGALVVVDIWTEITPEDTTWTARGASSNVWTERTPATSTWT